MGEARLALRGASLRRYEDPAKSADPKVRTLVALLGSVEFGPAPDPEFRAELRSQLVAVAPRLVAEGRAETPPAASVRSARRIVGLARPLTLLAGGVALIAVLFGGAVWISQRALPGDALYGLKRASENVALSLTLGDTAKARRYLSLAGTRAGEVSALLARTAAAGSAAPAGGLSPRTVALVDNTLSSADRDLRSASQLLGAQSVRDSSPAPLNILTEWAPGQLARLTSIVAAVPPGQVRDRALSSTQLVRQALARAASLRLQSGCRCLGNAPTDSLGPVPCVRCTPSTPGVSGGSSTPGGRSAARTTAPAPGATGHAAVPTGTGQPGVVGPTAGGQPLPTGAAPTPPAGTLPTSILPTSVLPTLPTATPTLSVPILPPLSSLPPPTLPTLSGLGGLPGVTSGPLG